MTTGRSLLLLPDASGYAADVLETVRCLEARVGVDDVLVGLRRGPDVQVLSPDLFAATCRPEDRLPGGLAAEDIVYRGSARGRAQLLSLLAGRPRFVVPVAAMTSLVDRVFLAEGGDGATADAEGVRPRRGIEPVQVETRGAKDRAEPIEIALAADAERPFCLLALNAVAREAQALIGRLVFALTKAGRSVVLADRRAPGEPGEDWIECEGVVAPPPDADLGAQAWDLVLLGGDLPFSVRQFASLEASLVLCARPSIAFREHCRVTPSLRQGEPVLRLDPDEEGGFFVVTAQARRPGALRLNASDITAAATLRRAPLAELIALATELERRRSKLEFLAVLDAYRERTGHTPTRAGIAEARSWIIHARAEGDAFAELCLADTVAGLLGIQDANEFCQAAFKTFLRRSCEVEFVARLPNALTVGIALEIIGNIAGSSEFGRLWNSRAVEGLQRVMVALRGTDWADRLARVASEGANALLDACREIVFAPAPVR